MTRALFGRDAEAAELTQLLTQQGVRAVAIVGGSGIGKTHLAESVLDECAARGALKGVARHLVQSNGDDVRPLLRALEEAASAGLETLYEPEAGLVLLADALGPNATLIGRLGVGPFRRLRKSGPLDEIPMSVAAAAERINSAIFVVCNWLAGFGQPVLLLLDDWGRTTGRTAELYQRLALAPDLGALRFLGTERPEEKFDLPTVRRVELGRLTPHGERDLAAAITELSGEPLHRFISAAAASTPLELIQTAARARASGAIRRSNKGVELDEQGLIVCAGEAVCAAAIDGLRLAAPIALEVANLLAVFGERAALHELREASGIGEHMLQQALSAGAAAGVVRVEGDFASLAHDRFRDALDDMMTPVERRLLAGQVAEALFALGVRGGDGSHGVAMLDNRIAAGFDAAGEAWIAQFEEGARQARGMGEVIRASRYAETGLALTERYGKAIRFDLQREAVLAANNAGDHSLACARAESLATIAASTLQKAEADELCAFVYRMSGNTEAAIEAARRGLRRMGVRVPRKPSLIDIVAAIAVGLARDPKRFARMPPLTTEVIAARAPMLRAVNALGSLTYEHDAALAIVLAMRVVTPDIAGGAAAGAAAQAFLCAELGFYQRAGAWARLSDMRQGSEQPLRAVSRQLASDFGHWHVQPRSQIERGKSIEEMAYAEGDLVVASYSSQHQVFDQLMSSAPLKQTADFADAAMEKLNRLRDETTVPRVAAMRQLIANMMRSNGEPWRLHGDYVGAAMAHVSKSRAANTERGLGLYAAMLAAAFGAHEHLVELYDRLARKYDQTPFHSQCQHWTFLSGLSLYRVGRAPEPLRVWLLRRSARDNPTDNAHRITILDAERARVQGRRTRALGLYAEALHQARASGCLLELGIVAEAAADGCRDMDDLSACSRFREAAAAAWHAYGANAVLAYRGHVTSAQPGIEREIELTAATREAERSNVAKSRFLAMIGHELRTPLQGAASLLELAERDPAQLDIAGLRASVTHLCRVVEDLTDQAAIDGGVLGMARAPFDAAGLLRTLVAEHDAARPGRISLRSCAEKTIVMGDAVRIRQIISNLVANALHHTDGPVEVSMRITPARDSCLALTYEIADCGRGISPAQLTRLLEPFERTERGGQGLGLGLSVAHRLARAMGGSLTFANREGGGALATLSLVLDSISTSDSHDKIRVLLVEDDALSRTLIARMLALAGCDVTEAAGFDSAMVAVERQAIDLAVIDARLSEQSGTALARRIQAMSGAMIVVMSASLDRALELEATDLAPIALLQKPVTQEALLEVLSVVPQSGSVLQLRSRLGNDATEIFSQVRPEIERLVNQIEGAITDGDDVGETAHRLAGLAAHFGFRNIHAAALTLEKYPSAPEALAGLRRAVGHADWDALAAT
jgi:signal transduction histidine kinase/ActR/RegA family two-component response regulator